MPSPWAVEVPQAEVVPAQHSTPLFPLVVEQAVTTTRTAPQEDAAEEPAVTLLPGKLVAHVLSEATVATHRPQLEVAVVAVA